MPEMIIPGTYIEVRAEGLIRPGPVSVGNIGIVGTARQGRLGNPPSGEEPRVYTPSNIGEAREIFGAADAFNNPTTANTPLTLVRALELAYASGANRVFAARVAPTSGPTAAVSATTSIAAATTNVTATSVAPGSGYNDLQIRIGAVSAGVFDVEIGRRFGTPTVADPNPDPESNQVVIESWRDVPQGAADFMRVINGDQPGYAYGQNASTGGGSNLFRLTGGAGDVTAERVTAVSTAGTDGANASAGDFADGLAALEGQDVQIVVAPTVAAEAGNMPAILRAHVQNASTDQIRRERIGIIGSDPSASPANLTAPAQDEGRLVFVGPGIKTFDAEADREVTLRGTYAAAAVAGLISSLDPEISPTNKTLAVNGVETEFNGTQLEQLLRNRVLPLEVRNGAVRIVRGITTSTNTAFSQITTRRIVDYARNGVRAAANPFIGKLNNERVREALKGSVNSLLADMVDQEMLTGNPPYELDVSATRDQQIRGIVQVTMVLRPTFSIDFIRVIMYLQ